MADTLDELLDEAIRGIIDARVHVALPGKIVSYDEATQTAAVQPIVRARYRTPDGESTQYKLPQLPKVPVAFPQGGNCSITWPLVVGDDVLLVVAERSLAEWKAGGGLPGDISPRDPRRFDLSDAVAIAGLSSPAHPLAQVLAGAMVLAAPDVRIGSNAATHAFVFGDAMKAVFNAHIHPTPAGPSGPPQEGAVAAPFDNAAAASYPHLSTKIKGE